MKKRNTWIAGILAFSLVLQGFALPMKASAAPDNEVRVIEAPEAEERAELVETEEAEERAELAEAPDAQAALRSAAPRAEALGAFDEIRNGYIEMPWDNHAPAADDDMSYAEAIRQITPDDAGEWTPANDRYVEEPASVQSRFPDYDAEVDILDYLKNAYPPTRSQSPYGTCWAHTAVALAEIDMLKNQLEDLSGAPVTTGMNYSELQLAYFCYHQSPEPLSLSTGDKVSFIKGADSFLDFGGNLSFAAQSMMRYNGLADEIEGATAYANAGSVLQDGLADEFARGHNQAVLKNAYEINLKENPKLAKQAILENGGIGVSIYADEKYLADDGKSFYNREQTATNHAVTIVGWDDAYSRTKFKTAPPADGAWLVRNSWTASTNFSWYSYFWLSYADTSLTSTAYVFDIADVSAGEAHDHVYNYDSQLHSIVTAPAEKMANVFTAQNARETIEAVSLDITLPKSAAIPYTIDVYKDLNDMADPESGTRIAALSGTLPFAGKYTIPLPSTVENNGLVQGESFSVVVTTTGSKIDRECDYNWKSQVNMDTHIGAGESFYYSGGKWIDLSTYSANDTRGNACIRALTDNNDASALPKEITGLSASGVTSDSVTLTWPAARDASSFQIRRSLSGGDLAGIGTVDGVRKYTDSGLSADTDYFYQVVPIRNDSPVPEDGSPILQVRTKAASPEVILSQIGGYTAEASWDKAGGCDGYKITWKAEGSNTTYTVSLSADRTSYRLTELTPKTTYTVNVIPMKDGKEGENAGTTSFTTAAGNPVAVSDLTAVPYNTTYVQLSWEELPDVSAIEVEQSEDGGTNYTSLGTYRNTTDYYAGNLDNTKKYTFRVTAVYNDQTKVSADPVSAWPKLLGTPVSSIQGSFAGKSITIGWSAVSGADYYAVYRRLGSESEYLPLDIVSGDTLSYTDTTITRGKRCYYRVFGVRENLLTDAQAMTDIGLCTLVQLAAVENVSAVPGTDSAEVSWDAAEGADHYVIEQYNAGWKDFETLSAKQTACTLSGLTPDTAYRFRIHATSEDGGRSVYEKEGDLYLADTEFSFTTTAAGEKDAPTAAAFQVSAGDTVYDAAAHSASALSEIEELNSAELTLSYAKVQNGTPGSFSAAAPRDAGTWQVRVSSPETEHYQAAVVTDAQWRFTISPAPATIRANDASKTVGAEDPGFTASVTGLKGSDTEALLTYTINREEGEAPGSYRITPAGDAVQGNYQVTFETGTLTITAKAAPEVIPPAPRTLTYSGQPQELVTPGTVSGGTILYAVSREDTVSGGDAVSGEDAVSGGDAAPAEALYSAEIPTGTEAGAYSVWYRVKGDDSHADMAPERIAASIAKAEYAGEKSIVAAINYDQAGRALTLRLPALPAGASYEDTGTVSQDAELITAHSVSDSTLIYTIAALSAEASAAITIDVDGGGNYLDYTVTVEISAKNTPDAGVRIAGGDKAVVYGDPGFSFTAVVADPGTGEGSLRWTSGDTAVAEIDGTTGAVTVKKAGAARITAAYASETTRGEASVLLTVEKKPVTITGVAVSDKTYDGTVSARITDAGSVAGLETGDAVRVEAGSAVFAQKDAGSRAVRFTGFRLAGSDAENYVLASQPADGLAKITPKPITVRVLAVNRSYQRGNTAVELRWEGLSGILQGDEAELDPLSLTGSVADANAGTGKKVTVKGIVLTGKDSANYLAAQPENLTVDIGKAAPEQASLEVSRTYLYTQSSADSVDLAALLPEDAGAVSCGDIRTEGDISFTAGPVIAGNTVSYTLGGGKGKAAGTIRVKAETQNYQDVSITLKLVQTVLSLQEKEGKSLVTRTARQLTVGKSFTLVPVFAGEADGRVVWESSNPDVVTVTQDGKAAAKSAGAALITARSEEDPSLTAGCAVSVSDPVTEITLDKKRFAFGTGERFTLTAAVLPFTATQNMIWSTDNRESVMLCDENGTELEGEQSGKKKQYALTALQTVTVYAIKPGSAKITAQAADGSGKKAVCSVTAGEPVSSLRIYGNGSVTELSAGKTLAMKADWGRIKPKNQGLSWTVTTPAGGDASFIAAISTKGVLRGITPGLVRVTAASQANPEKTASVDIQITAAASAGPKLVYLGLDNAKELEKSGLKAGKRFTLKTNIRTDVNGKLPASALSWVSSDESVAAVSAKGVVRALKAGEATITVLSANTEEGTVLSDAVTFSVTSLVKSVKPDKSKLTLGTQEGSRFGTIGIAKLVPEDATDASIRWTPANANIALAAIPAGSAAKEGSFGTAGAECVTKPGERLALKALLPGVTKLNGITTDGSKKKLTCTITVRGQVTGLRLTESAGKNGLGGIRTVSAGGADASGKTLYQGTMKAGASLTLKPLLEINGVSMAENKTLYASYKKVTDVSVSWRSTDTSLVKVNKNGKISVMKTAPAGSSVSVIGASADGSCIVEYRITTG